MADRDDVRGRTFLRERPLHRRDVDELGGDAPDVPVLVASMPDCRLDRLDGTSLTEPAGEAWAGRTRPTAGHRTGA